MKTNIIWAACMAVIFWAGSAMATLITNGDFETGNFGTWKSSGDVNIINTTNIFSAAEGMDGYFAGIGFDDGPVKSRLWQNFDVSGASMVRVSFDWVFDFDDYSSNTNDVFISLLRDFDGSALNNITLEKLKTTGRKNNPDTQLLFGTFDAIIDISGFNTTNARLQFSLTENNGGLYSRAGIDNVSVNPVPEPTTILLFGAGLAGLIAVQRRKNK